MMHVIWGTCFFWQLQQLMQSFSYPCFFSRVHKIIPSENGCLWFISQDDDNISLQLHLLLQGEFAFGIAWWEGGCAGVTCPQR